MALCFTFFWCCYPDDFSSLISLMPHLSVSFCINLHYHQVWRKRLMFQIKRTREQRRYAVQTSSLAVKRLWWEQTLCKRKQRLKGGETSKSYCTASRDFTVTVHRSPWSSSRNRSLFHVYVPVSEIQGSSSFKKRIGPVGRSQHEWHHIFISDLL